MGGGKIGRVIILILLFNFTQNMIERFLGYIAYNRCLSGETVLKYRKALKKFNLFLGRKGKNADHPEEITLEDVSGFISDIIEQGLSPTYCNWLLIGIKSYLNYLRDILYMDVIDPHKIRYCKTPERNVGYFNEKQKRLILNAVNNGTCGRDIICLKHKLLVYMFFHTWLRCHELIKIKVDEIWENLQVIGKWGKRRTVYLRKEILDMIEEYLAKRNKKSEYLFPHRCKEGQHMTDAAVRGVFFKLAKKLGFWIHPHKFRHTFATDLLRIPWSNIYNVAKLLGHSNINTTQIYLGLNDAELKKIQFWLKF